MARITHHRVRALAAVAEKLVKNVPNHPTAKSMQGEINRLRLAAEALDNVSAHRSPLDTPAAHALKVAKAAKRLDSEALASLNRLGEICRDGRDAAQRRIAEKVDLRPNAHAQEIRTRFAAMSSKDKAETISRWVEGNNGPSLAAIVKADPFLSGITEEQRVAYEKSIISKHAGAELDELAAVDVVWEEGYAATQIAVGFAKELTDPAEVAKIEREAAEADAAGDAFNQSLQ